MLGFLTGEDRELCCHRLGGGCLVFTAKGHKYTACADGGIEPLHKTSLVGGFQAACHFPQRNEQGTAQGGQVFFIYFHIGVLNSTVGIEEISGKIGNFLALPGHYHPGFFRNNSYPVGF